MNVLTIAGSDPSSGAGIQGDIKTFDALGVHVLCVVTALTSQNSSRFFKSEPVSAEMIRNQIRAVFSDFKIDAIKIGMVYDKKTIKTIHGELQGIQVPVVLDPIFESTTGGVLLRPDALSYFKRLLVPLARIITPNTSEAEKISGVKIKTLNDAKRAAQKIHSMGAKSVVVKGGHMHGSSVTDILYEGGVFHAFSQKRLVRASHGGGCIFSAALCASIAKGKSISESVRLAQKTSFESIREAARIGSGLAIARQKNPDAIERELFSAINRFADIEGIYEHIPEVQTNFVYCRPHPRSISDILGLEGRLVRAGRSVLVAGKLKYGGSRHVASAVLEMAKKFPSTRSGINIRYDERTINGAIARGFEVSYYDRSLEQRGTKKAEGMTVPWGVKNAIKGLKSPPDMIYHKGDLGKEPMILIFGKSPGDILTKLGKIL